MTSALALLTELKELRLHLSGNRIGRGPRELQLHGRRIIVPISLRDPGGGSVAAWGLTSLCRPR